MKGRLKTFLLSVFLKNTLSINASAAAQSTPSVSGDATFLSAAAVMFFPEPAPEISTFTFIDKPTRSGLDCNSFASKLMRTGTRCTTLIQFPVAFCGGKERMHCPYPLTNPSPCHDRPLYFHINQQSFQQVDQFSFDAVATL